MNATEMQKMICSVYGGGAVADQMCQKGFVKFLGTIDILAKQFFAVGLCYALEDVKQHLGLYSLGANSRR